MNELEVDFFFSFRSPWSYFAVSRLLDLQREYAVAINLRVVNPIYIRYHDFFDRAPDQWMNYTFLDLLRHSEYLSIPIGLPRPDPVNVTLPAESSDHLVLMLNPLGIAAQALGCGVEFAAEVAALVWDGRTDQWHCGDHLERAAERAGLDFQSILGWVNKNAEQWPEQLQGNDMALAEFHWGVPTMVFAGEPFFGQDKIELLLWRLKQHGLQRRLTQ